MGLSVIITDADTDFPPCAPMVHPDFDRYEGGFREIGFGVETLKESYQRRVLRFEGGRAILQNANTSAVDVAMLPLTPGTLPPD